MSTLTMGGGAAIVAVITVLLLGIAVLLARGDSA